METLLNLERKTVYTKTLVITLEGAIASYLLPPANEFWGKVMFLHVSGILFTGGRGISAFGSRGVVSCEI